MPILLVGMNYQTASIEIRERLYLTGDRLHHFLAALQNERLSEVVIVSTCNRLEVYVHTDNVDRASETITSHLVEQASLPGSHLKNHLQYLFDRDAVQHLMRVAAGLESLVFGETEILGQIVGALKQAQQAHTTGSVLSRLFHAVLHSGKRARTETVISRHTLSVSHAAVLMAKEQLGGLSHVKALVIGAGQMGERALQALKAHGATDVRVINRTFSKATALAKRLEIEPVEWQQLDSALSEADVIITATSAPQPILNATIMAARTEVTTRQLTVIDIAVPRNVDHSVRQLQNVRLYDIDDLQAVVEDHRAKRQSETAQVETIIAEEVAAYLDWLNSRRAVSTIVALREKTEAIAALELDQALHRLPNLTDHEREVVTQMAYRIINKLLHAPTVALHERAAEGEHFAYLHAVRQLFNIDGETE